MAERTAPATWCWAWGPPLGPPDSSAPPEAAPLPHPPSPAQSGPLGSVGAQAESMCVGFLVRPVRMSNSIIYEVSSLPLC